MTLFARVFTCTFMPASYFMVPSVATIWKFLHCSQVELCDYSRINSNFTFKLLRSRLLLAHCLLLLVRRLLLLTLLLCLKQIFRGTMKRELARFFNGADLLKNFFKIFVALEVDWKLHCFAAKSYFNLRFMNSCLWTLHSMDNFGHKFIYS